MTFRGESPSWICMRILALVLVLLGGCSWLTASAHNDPRVGCSRTAGRIDAGIAIAGLVGVAAAIALRAQDPVGEYDHNGDGIKTSLQISAGLTVAIVEAVQSHYGLGVADRCQDARAKLTMTAAPGSL